MSKAADEAMTSSALLDASEDQIIAFLSKCRTRNGHFDVSSIANLNTLPPQERDTIGTKLMLVMLLLPLDFDSAKVLHSY